MVDGAEGMGACGLLTAVSRARGTSPVLGGGGMVPVLVLAATVGLLE